jgi:hypothetical protein
MTMKQKIIFIIILILVSVAIISLGSYFGWQWYKLRQQNKIEVNLLKPQVIEYNISEDPKNWPSDFPKTGTEDFEVLSVRETIYSPTWVIAEKTLKTKYSKIIAFNFFKDYLNNTFWKINEEISGPDQIQYSLKAEREGDISITINPFENNSSIINIKYEINPQNPKKPQIKTATTSTNFPEGFPKELIIGDPQNLVVSEGKTFISAVYVSNLTPKELFNKINNFAKNNNFEIQTKAQSDDLIDIIIQPKPESKYYEKISTLHISFSKINNKTTRVYMELK